MRQIAETFGTSLDNDDFETTKQTLSQDCKYTIGEEVLIGPTAICNSYEQNMLEGRKKLDKLEWGKSRIEPINEEEYYVHFTDFLTHIGLFYTHRCIQKLTIRGGEIVEIVHIADEEEQERLNKFYRMVGLK